MLQSKKFLLEWIGKLKFRFLNFVSNVIFNCKQTNLNPFPCIKQFLCVISFSRSVLPNRLQTHIHSFIFLRNIGCGSCHRDFCLGDCCQNVLSKISLSEVGVMKIKPVTHFTGRLVEEWHKKKKPAVKTGICGFHFNVCDFRYQEKVNNAQASTCVSVDVSVFSNQGGSFKKRI